MAKYDKFNQLYAKSLYLKCPKITQKVVAIVLWKV